MCRDIIKAQYESDYVIAHRFQNKKSTIVFSSDADMVALCGSSCLVIRSFVEEKGSKRKRKKGETESACYVYEICGGSNTMMDELQHHIHNRSDNFHIKSYTRAQIYVFNSL